MNRSVAKLAEEAFQLPQSDQFKLARTLLENAQGESQPGIDQAWDDEIQRRIDAIDSGSAQGRPFAEVLREADQRLRRS